MPTPEFVFLNDQAARVTAFHPDDAGGFTLVIIARGGTDRDRTLELLNANDLAVRLDNGEPRPMRTTGIEIRSSGEGPQGIHRIEATLVPANAESQTAPTDPVTERLDQIITLLTEIRDRLG